MLRTNLKPGLFQSHPMALKWAGRLWARSDGWKTGQDGCKTGQDGWSSWPGLGWFHACRWIPAVKRQVPMPAQTTDKLEGWAARRRGKRSQHAHRGGARNGVLGWTMRQALTMYYVRLELWKAGKMGRRVTTRCSSGAQGGKAWMYLHARGQAGYVTGRWAGAIHCLLLQVHCLSGTLTGLSWTVAAWIITRPSTGLDGFKAVWMKPGRL